MIKKISVITTVFLSLNFLNFLQALPSSTLSGAAPERIIIKNRILAKINGKVISVLDVMKKMDLVFHREYPQFSDSVPAKHQFYSMYWKIILNNMIDEELILANAEEFKVTVSDGEARQELEDLFGPNVVLNIDKLGLTYAEALKMVLKEILVRKMDYFMVHSKAINRVGPKEIREAYEIYAKEHPIEASWVYQMITVRSTSELNCAAVAQQAYQCLNQEKISLDKLSDTLKDRGVLGDITTSLSISEDLELTEKTISSEHKEILTNLATGSFSQPTSQISRVDKSKVFRIFYLKSSTKAGVVPFNDVEEMLKTKLVGEATEKESEIYHKKLRQRFGITDEYLSSMIPNDFQPFILS